MTRAQIRDEQTRLLGIAEKAQADLHAVPGLVGVGVGLRERAGATTGELCLRVYLEKKRPAGDVPAEHLVPASIRGAATDVIEYRPIRRRTAAASTDGEDRKRPLQGGYKVTNNAKGGEPGTLGIIAQTTGASPSYVLLSNSHVLYSGGAGTGATIYQPDVSCCCCNDVAANAARQNVENGTVDCAIATIQRGVTVAADLRELGSVDGTELAVVGDAVEKVGYVTGITRGRVVDVNFPMHRTDDVDLRNQILIEPIDEYKEFLAGGDSGSVVVIHLGGRHLVVGLGVAGNDDGDGVANHIHNVIAAMNITIPASIHLAQQGAPVSGSAAQDWNELLGRYTARGMSIPLGRTYIELIRRSYQEVMTLGRTDKRVMAVWRSGNGAEFVNSNLEAARRPDVRMVKEVGGVSATTLVERMADILAERGSPRLAETIRAHRAAVLDCDACDTLESTFVWLILASIADIAAGALPAILRNFDPFPVPALHARYAGGGSGLFDPSWSFDVSVTGITAGGISGTTMKDPGRKLEEREISFLLETRALAVSGDVAFKGKYGWFGYSDSGRFRLSIAGTRSRVVVSCEAERQPPVADRAIVRSTLGHVDLTVSGFRWPISLVVNAVSARLANDLARLVETAVSQQLGARLPGYITEAVRAAWPARVDAA